jgi:hypothetical protein
MPPALLESLLGISAKAVGPMISPFAVLTAEEFIPS